MKDVARRNPIIGGNTIVGEAGPREVIDPYDGSIVGEVTYVSRTQAESAITAAISAFERTRIQSSGERSDVLNKCSRALARDKEKIALLITRESGKPITYARAEVDRAVLTFAAAAEGARHARDGHVIDLSAAPNGAGRRASYQYFPLGVIVAITPFNFPLNLVAHKVAPAIASGNSIVLKPAPQTPLTSFALADILVESGLIPGALNVVPCENQVAETLVTHPEVKMVTFTGSTAVGWKLKALAAKARVTLELGGNGMIIVDEIEDIEKLVKQLSMAAFNYAGQVCIGLQNLLVRRSLYQGLLDKLLEAAKSLPVGDPKDAKVVVGPMISAQAAEKVDRWIAEAVSKGAKHLTGNFNSPKLIKPTILSNVPHVCEIWSDEAFGPILNVEAYDELSDAISIVNQSRYGLQAALFSNDLSKINRAYEQLEVGALIVNDTNNYRVDSMPYGGVKDSGLGREGVVFAMREMSEMKLLVEK